MTAKPAELTEVHSRLLKCTLETENARAFWKNAGDNEATSATADRAFSESWFGARSLQRVKVLLVNFRARFVAYPHAMAVLRVWSDMDPVMRALVCHWHVQLTDPIYRMFTGVYLVERHEGARAEVTRDMVVRWLGDRVPAAWKMATRIQLASQLLVTARAAGLVENISDPRRLKFPRVSDEALTYALYLLRGVEFEGTLLENPYTASVGFDRRTVEDRLRALSALRFRRQGDLIDFDWAYSDLQDWAASALEAEGGAA